jgi:hypothetical protein
MARENSTFIDIYSDIPIRTSISWKFPGHDDWRVKENLPDTGANFYMVGDIIQDHQPLVISRHRPAANLVKLR